MTLAAPLLLLAALAAPAPSPAPTPSAGAPRPLTVDDIYALRDVGAPQISPDGRWVAHTVTRLDAKADESDSDLYMSPLAGGAAVRLTASPKSDNTPRFSPDGRYVAFLSGREGTKTQVWLLDRQGGEPVKLTSYKASVSELEWSPDSTRLALVVSDVDPDDQAEDEEAGNKKKEKTPKPVVVKRLQFKRDEEGFLGEIRSHVHVFDVAAKTSVQVTSGAYDDSEPRFSPDGQWIAFQSNRTDNPDANKNSDIFVVRAAAGAQPRALATGPGSDSTPVWSRDGKTIAYVAGGNPKDMWYGSNHLAVIAVDNGAPVPLTAALDRNVSEPRWSGDGRWLYFLLEDGGNSHLARVPAAGGAIEKVVTGERDITAYDLGPHGEIALVASDPQTPEEVYAESPAGALTRVSSVNTDVVRGLRLGRVERFKAKSADGTMIDGFLTRPPDAPAGQRLPTVLRIHGGPASQFSTAFELEWQMLAAHGYAVVAANPRGSTGYGTAFSRAIWADWGNKDYEDVMAAVDHVVQMGVADPEKLGVGGWSYGGILTDYVITKTTRFKAAISGASETNYLADYGHDHYQYEWETELGLPWQNVERWLKLSPWFQVEKITTPTLLLCGTDDWNVPLINSEQLYLALRRLGRETELIIYPGQGHAIRTPSYQKDRYERYLAWYGRFLGGRVPAPALAAQATLGGGR